MKIINTKEALEYYCPIINQGCIGNKCMAWSDWFQYIQNKEVIVHKDKGYCSYLNKDAQ